jgi:tetratricopeptide (TPR) repeat protein
MLLEKRKGAIPSFILILLGVFFLSACAGKPKTVEKPAAFSNLLSPEAEELVRRGVSYHDRGDYKNALDCYNQAMVLAPEHPVVYYETAYTYISTGDFNTALTLAEKGIASAEARKYNEVMPTLLDLKGSVLYNLNRNQEAIDVYYKAINQYNISTTYTYYNLGINYYALNRKQEAVDMLVKGLLINPNHASSNYLLGKICVEEGRLTQGFYALCYFLLQEPSSNRASQAYATIQYMLSGKGQTASAGGFAASDALIMRAVSLDEASAGTSDAVKFHAKIRYCFTTLEEQKKSGAIRRGADDGLWWDFYSPFFYRIIKSDTYSPTFFRYISLSADPEGETWVENERGEIEGFFTWLNSFPN